MSPLSFFGEATKVEKMEWATKSKQAIVGTSQKEREASKQSTCPAEQVAQWQVSNDQLSQGQQTLVQGKQGLNTST